VIVSLSLRLHSHLFPLFVFGPFLHTFDSSRVWQAPSSLVLATIQRIAFWQLLATLCRSHPEWKDSTKRLFSTSFACFVLSTSLFPLFQHMVPIRPTCYSHLSAFPRDLRFRLNFDPSCSNRAWAPVEAFEYCRGIRFFFPRKMMCIAMRSSPFVVGQCCVRERRTCPPVCTFLHQHIDRFRCVLAAVDRLETDFSAFRTLTVHFPT